MHGAQTISLFILCQLTQATELFLNFFFLRKPSCPLKHHDSASFQLSRTLF